MDSKFGPLERSVAAYAESRGCGPVRDCSTSGHTYRRTYRLDERYVAKVFLPEAHDRYRREHAFLALGVEGVDMPRLEASTFDAQQGGYLVMTALPGEPLEAILGNVTADEYGDLLEDLGRSLGAIHAVAASKAGLPEKNGLEAERRGHFAAVEDSIACLQAARLLPPAEIERAREATRLAQRAAFASPQRLIHGDVHRGNVLVARREGRWTCALIDFEESGPNPVELDLVYPFLSILGEAFPGRRFASSWDRLWRRFVAGYVSGGGAEPEPALLVGHAAAWFLWVAAHCVKEGHATAGFYAASALEALALNLAVHRA
ncbi:hypothetical protein BWI17_01520 [Betaproteobacteria bacterium GR16-43]|nr:hypothetical protein BWI17_01520 [Betaproteobacteria bacterium GR16-43]